MLRDLMNNQKNELKLVLVASLIISLVYCLFSYNLPWRFNSPDEAANAFFAKRLAQGQSLSAPLPVVGLSDLSIIHPRSLGVINNYLIPTSFVGWSLIAGLFGYLFGLWLLPFLTPLLAIVGLVSFFYLVKKYLDTKVAWWGLVLLAALPSYWYYHSRNFYHNALFFDLVLLGICLFAYLDRHKKWWQYGLVGLVFGLALTIRTSEIFWLGAFMLWWWWRRRLELNNKFVLVSLVGLVVGFLPTIFSNIYLYGHPFSIGYKSGLFFPSTDLATNTWLIKELVLPFGVHFKNIWQASLKYLLILAPAWSILVIVAWVKAIYDWRNLPEGFKQIIGPILLASGWLVVLYGSWYFVDSPNPNDITLGTSYARYWLPIYVFSLLPVLYFMKRVSYRQMGKYIVGSSLVIYVAASAYLVWWQPPEGLSQIKGNIYRFENINQAVQNITPADSIIVAERTDKMFWPERQVIFSLANQSDFMTAQSLLKLGISVYKFQPSLSAKDLGDLNKKWLGQYYLQLEPTGFENSGYSLYKIMSGGL